MVTNLYISGLRGLIVHVKSIHKIGKCLKENMLLFFFNILSLCMQGRKKVEKSAICWIFQEYPFWAGYSVLVYPCTCHDDEFGLFCACVFYWEGGQQLGEKFY